ncbi:hypothetical protein [Dolichospermum sp. UHCC 0259]|uniref:hypothetical protein n=1 Tax=Dolichospermum sp. UHCC 0259 TaxID=2590010 RepID=UPI0014480C09|nr:hypothetical protein [Dolichospermum sp. UHCC 0259]MTJ48394.1 hypothetical protein [Dolichospermum sp. UHCC 0259]
MNQIKPAKTPRLRNHILPKGKVLATTLDRKFGVSLADFDRAIGGDVAAAQKIGELARQGRLSQELAPKLAQAYIEIINGSEAYNKATADILLQAGKSAIAIDKAGSQVMLGQQKFVHQRQELAQEFVLGKNTENTRHKYQVNYTQIKGYIDAHLVGVDQQVAILEQSNRPEIKQVAADEQYQQKTMNEALNKGENARYDLIPEKNYRGIKGKFQEFMGALGF